MDFYKRLWGRMLTLDSSLTTWLASIDWKIGELSEVLYQNEEVRLSVHVCLCMSAVRFCPPPWMGHWIFGWNMHAFCTVRRLQYYNKWCLSWFYTRADNSYCKESQNSSLLSAYISIIVVLSIINIITSGSRLLGRGATFLKIWNLFANIFCDVDKISLTSSKIPDDLTFLPPRRKGAGILFHKPLFCAIFVLITFF